jgi:hypothetical protein
MRIVWSIRDLVEIAKKRQQNEFDMNIIVTGARGNGKSSFAFKFLKRFGKKFNAWKHQIYSRKDLMKLLEKSKYGCIFDDEAIRTGYKRNFFDQDQRLLIQMLNMYRDNFNVYVACLPSFYDLDKGLRDLFKIHIHIIERGLGVVHVANESALYSDDKWDVKHNKKVEESWSKYKMKNPNYTPKYNRLTTFRGYIHIPKLTPKQEAQYKEIKETKRKIMYEEEIKEEEDGTQGFYDRLIKRMNEGELTKDSLQEICLANGLKYSAVRSLLNVKLKDMGVKKTVADLLRKTNENKTIKSEVVKDIFAYKPS